MITRPISAYAKLGGFYFLPRTLDKIRLHARGELHPDHHEFIGKAYDGRLCHHLGINYEAYICLVGYRFWHDESYLDTYEERPYFMSTPEIEGFINLLNQVTSRMSSVSKEIANYK